MTQEELMAIEDAASDAGMDFRKDYSGRWMYGDRCIGVVGNSAQLVKFVFNLARSDAEISDELMEELNNPATDDMANEKIWYWPGLTMEE